MSFSIFFSSKLNKMSIDCFSVMISFLAKHLESNDGDSRTVFCILKRSEGLKWSLPFCQYFTKENKKYDIIYFTVKGEGKP